jgi:hypothetical protein
MFSKSQTRRAYPETGLVKGTFTEGFTVKHLVFGRAEKPNGFIEYTNGENAWRAVSATGYLFIHCIWMNPNNVKQKGYGSILVKDCLKMQSDRENLV